MKASLRALLSPMLVSALLGSPAFAQTVPQEFISLSATYVDSSAQVQVQVYASVGSSSASATWYQFNYATGQSNDCAAFSSPDRAFDGSLAVSPNGTAALRFKPILGNCPFPEIVVTCRSTGGTASYFSQGLELSKFGGRATDNRNHRVLRQFVSLECSLPGVDGEYVANTGMSLDVRVVSGDTGP